MLDNFGFVHDLAGYVTRDDGTASFAIDEMTTASEMDFQPQLVLSIASAEPLHSLDFAQSLLRAGDRRYLDLLHVVAGKMKDAYKKGDMAAFWAARRPGCFLVLDSLDTFNEPV